ncbi:hypothetical protein GB931_04055 [Modestobacter sp. I12A-02628]|uniref:Uncharacterized protein n=1 Tax=Goekera deserti TaxID=2497753 RepID=A0A7K3WIZ5_9ACTN|nr:hypothetical protein [Goekera deserti]MPQ97112.1 hypothetical protein [Goekera deserti]NDI46570.1 hypothetical protein [Goekera deserti]NEL56326.1 hypothetical protein [Goekera deserti]
MSLRARLEARRAAADARPYDMRAARAEHGGPRWVLVVAYGVTAALAAGLGAFLDPSLVVLAIWSCVVGAAVALRARRLFVRRHGAADPADAGPLPVTERPTYDPQVTGRLVLHRPTSRLLHRPRSYRVLVDGVKAAEMWHGEPTKLTLPAGRHDVRVMIDRVGSATVPVDVPDGETTHVVVEPIASGLEASLAEVAGQPVFTLTVGRPRVTRYR